MYTGLIPCLLISKQGYKVYTYIYLIYIDTQLWSWPLMSIFKDCKTCQMT